MNYLEDVESTTLLEVDSGMQEHADHVDAAVTLALLPAVRTEWRETSLLPRTQVETIR